MQDADKPVNLLRSATATQMLWYQLDCLPEPFGIGAVQD